MNTRNLTIGLLFAPMLGVLLACTPPQSQKDPGKAANAEGEAEPKPQPEQAQMATISEAFVTPSVEVDNVDSIAIYQHADGSRAIVTAKGTHKLVVFDAVSGEKLLDVGEPGNELGQLMRPNGILVLGDWCFVVERDNHRLQIFSLPEFKSVAIIGQDVLKRPYGITGRLTGNTASVFISDDYEPTPGVEPGPEFYTERVKHFDIVLEKDNIQVNLVRSFGDAEGPGRLFKVETILLDPARDLLYIADEKGPTSGIKLFSTRGSYSGRLKTPKILGELEGMGIYAIDDGGYLIITDQQPDVSVFHVFNRENLDHVGAFRGVKTANTDGIAVDATPAQAFAAGGLWAIHDDRALAGFDWSTIQQALNLPVSTTQ